MAGVALAGFLLFPSLGLVQKYLGTAAAYTYFAVGALVLIAVSVRGLAVASRLVVIDRRWIRFTMAALFGSLVIAFIVLQPSFNAQSASSTSHVGIGGSDRDESLRVGIREMLAGRYPYYRETRLQNTVTQLPGSLLRAAPFELLGNATWQNVFWLGAWFVVVRWLFGGDQLALGFIGLVLFASPVVLKDFVTGSDLAADAIAILIGMLALVRLVPDASASTWQKIAAGVFTGIALSSRLNYLLLVPLLFAALTQRAGLRDAVSYLSVVGLTFAGITLPFYWYDPAGFAPLYLHNKFSQFGEVKNGGWLFPGLSLLFSVFMAAQPGNRMVSVWLIRCGLVMALPVLFVVGLATFRTGGPNFLFADYALSSVLIGALGAGMALVRAEPI